jgi:hypothetical protein
MKVGADGSALIGVLSNAGGFAARLIAQGAEGQLEVSHVDSAEGGASTRVIHVEADSR